MMRRLSAWTAATAVLAVFVASPHTHVHLANGDRVEDDRHHAADAARPLVHWHVSAHAPHTHDDDSMPASPASGDEDIVGVSAFQPRAESGTGPAPPALAEPLQSLTRAPDAGLLVELPHARAHAPPSPDRQPARAPPEPRQHVL